MSLIDKAKMDRTKKINPELIDAFRRTIRNLKNGAAYQWGHMGACNCGNLAQELTRLSKSEIHQFAMQKTGDWHDQLIDYCPNSGYPMDLMISKMMEAGLTRDELAHLERLSDPKILARIPFPKRSELLKNKKEDVILYLETWKSFLEEKWSDSQNIILKVNSNQKISENLPHRVLA